MFTFYTPLFLYITSTNFQNRVITQVHCWGPSQGLEGTGGGEGPWRRNPASLAAVGFRWREPPPPPGHQAPGHLSSRPRAPNTACAPADRPHEVPVHGGLCSLPPGAPPRPAHCPIHVVPATLGPRGAKRRDEVGSERLAKHSLPGWPTGSAAGRGPASGHFQPHSDESFGAPSGLQGVGQSSPAPMRAQRWHAPASHRPASRWPQQPQEQSGLRLASLRIQEPLHEQSLLNGYRCPPRTHARCCLGGVGGAPSAALVSWAAVTQDPKLRASNNRSVLSPASGQDSGGGRCCAHLPSHSHQNYNETSEQPSWGVA